MGISAAPEEDGEVLLEVSDAVRETLIETMDQQELLAAVDDLDADELAELAADLPHEVVYEALKTRDEEERAQAGGGDVVWKTAKWARLWISNW